MEIELIYTAARTARADVKGGVLQVRMPRHWPRCDKERAIARFQRWAVRRNASLAKLPPPVSRPPMTEGDLWDLVRDLNARTVQVDVQGVRIGQARFTRLAQANYRTRVLTFSRFAVNSLPEPALRYLIVHELTHLRIPDHSQAFWDLVARFIPDWKYWRRVAQAHFVRAADAGPAQEARDRPPPDWAPLPQPGPVAAQRPGLGGDDGEAAFMADDFDDDDPGRPAYDPESPGDVAARALFEDLAGPHGTQLALFAELAPDYPV